MMKHGRRTRLSSLRTKAASSSFVQSWEATPWVSILSSLLAEAIVRSSFVVGKEGLTMFAVFLQGCQDIAKGPSANVDAICLSKVPVLVECAEHVCEIDFQKGASS